MFDNLPSEMNLEELARQVEALLRQRGLVDVQQDHRISPVPDARTIRYYTSLGLLDRPRVEGRQARYSSKHVLQLLAVKALQGIPMPLAEIQARLYGRSSAELEALLATISEPRRHVTPALKPVCWHEIVIEPGLKILAESSWQSEMDTRDLEEKISAALAALRASIDEANGGKTT